MELSEGTERAKDVVARQRVRRAVIDFMMTV